MDIVNKIVSRRALSPVVVTDNTAQVCQIIDRSTYDSLMFVIATGTLADADATFAVTMDHGDASNLSDAASVPAAELNGTLAGASFTFTNDDTTREIGYAGVKRYVRLTITPSANTGNAPLAVVAILSDGKKQP